MGDVVISVMEAPSHPTLLLPDDDRRASVSSAPTGGLATDILVQSARRLRVLALLYAFTFLMAGYVPRLVLTGARARMIEDPVSWVPGLVAIAVALIVAAVTVMDRVPLSMVMNDAIAFEIVGSYGIAFAEFFNGERLATVAGWQGLSWVAAWVPLFSVVVPTRPRRAALAALGSVSAVPLVIALSIVTGRTALRPTAVEFFFVCVFPYLLVALMAYVGACVVYGLGKEVTRAYELGSYVLVERLGHGGMGEVWRARHRLLARPAAIKLIRPSLEPNGPSGATEDAVRRFEREAQVTARLTSPHTVQLFDFGVARDGGFYYVMELLDGLDLELLVRRHGPLPAERVIHLLRQVCHSLAEAESHGLVHRDIKPANLFTCRYGGEHDFLKVLDFGIVKRTHETMDTAAINLTRGNVVQGTPAYLAPEQALGDSPVDARADIYATGCVAYWLLTGALVFKADTPMGLIVHHAHTPPTPPSARSELPIPPALDRLIMECLAKNPAERPQSAKELAGRLAEIKSLAPWTEERAHEWWHTHEPAQAQGMRA
jgi:eukaryotic-like serine/threonine-protein kinase